MTGEPFYDQSVDGCLVCLSLRSAGSPLSESPGQDEPAARLAAASDRNMATCFFVSDAYRSDISPRATASPSSADTVSLAGGGAAFFSISSAGSGAGSGAG